MLFKLLLTSFPSGIQFYCHDCTFKMRRNETRTGNMHQDGVRDWQHISFDKKMFKSSFASLTVPARFVRQHGDKFQEFVTVESEVESHRWTVKVSVGFPHGRPQVAFHRGWKAFVVSNGLVKGDRMKFTLVAKSKFKVSIARSSENSEARPRLQTLETSLKDDPPKESLRPHHFADVTEKPELRRDECNRLVAKACEAVEAKTVVHSISNAVAAAAAAGSSLSSSSDMDSHFFEPLQATAPLPFFYS